MAERGGLSLDFGDGDDLYDGRRQPPPPPPPMPNGNTNPSRRLPTPRVTRSNRRNRGSRNRPQRPPSRQNTARPDERQILPAHYGRAPRNIPPPGPLFLPSHTGGPANVLHPSPGSLLPSRPQNGVAPSQQDHHAPPNAPRAMRMGEANWPSSDIPTHYDFRYADNNTSNNQRRPSDSNSSSSARQSGHNDSTPPSSHSTAPSSRRGSNGPRMVTISAVDWGHAQDQINRLQHTSYDQQNKIASQQKEINELKTALQESKEKAELSQEAYEKLATHCGEPGSSTGQGRGDREDKDGDDETGYDVGSEKNKEPAEDGNDG